MKANELDFLLHVIESEKTEPDAIKDAHIAIRWTCAELHAKALKEYHQRIKVVASDRLLKKRLIEIGMMGATVPEPAGEGQV